MHPFLPTLSIVFLAMADAFAAFLRMNRHRPDMVYHAPGLVAILCISLLAGSGLAFWLRRFGLRFPSWIAIASLVLVVALGLS